MEPTFFRRLGDKMENILKKLESPILFLAGAAILLYLFELFHLIPSSLMIPTFWLNFIIDLIFCVDLVLKSVVFGKTYFKSPWFLIDLVSVLPIISSVMDLMGVIGLQLEAARAARGARIIRVARIARTARLARVARSARVAKAIRVSRGLTFLKTLPGEMQNTPLFDKSLRIGVPLLLVCFIAIAFYFQQVEVGLLEKDLRRSVEQANTLIEIERIPHYLNVSGSQDPRIEMIWVSKEIDGGQERFAFSIEAALRNADRIQGFLLILLLLTVVGIVYIGSSLSADQKKSQKIFLMGQFFSPGIVERFDTNPEIVERYYKPWMSVFFIDVRGFTSATEKGYSDIEGLALKLRRLMDIAHEKIVVTHEGIVDKFMGDAIMGWIGGRFSRHWNILSPVRGLLSLDEIEKNKQDIRSIEREINEHQKVTHSLPKVNDGDPEFPPQIEERRTYLEDAKKDAEAYQKVLIEKQDLAKREDASLEVRYTEALGAYKREVAKSAVLCCLRVSQEASVQEDVDAFRELKIGIFSGPVLVGNFGSTDQVGFTVLGPTVNRAARLEPASAQCGCRILIDSTTYDLLKDDPDLRFRALPQIAVKGLEGDLTVYEPFENEEVSQEFLHAFGCGVQAIQNHDLPLAIKHLEDAHRLRENGDLSSLLWIEECQAVLSEGRPIESKRMSK